MTRIWESSVVIGLRDLQWKNLRPECSFPDEYLALGGNAETALGDAAIALSDRYILIEVKSTFAEISEEWDKNWRKGALTAVDDAFADLPSPILARAFLQSSMQCHFFAYWQTSRRVLGRASGAIMVEPYVSGILRRKGFEKPALDRAEALTQQLGLAASWVNKDPHRQVSQQLSRCARAPAEAAMRGEVKFIVEDDEKIFWDHLGLPLEEFKEYVASVISACKKNPSKNREISSIVMSSSGRTFVHFTDTEHLETIFSNAAPSVAKEVDKGEVKIAEFRSTTFGPAPPGGVGGPLTP